MFLGIEIGGTKLQLGVGEDTGKLDGLWRGTVDVQAGPEGIRRQIVGALPELLSKSGLGKCHLHGVGIGFGGPVDDSTQSVIRSHQIAGWDGFPLADWISDIVGVEAVLGNDADVAGLAEALHGAGKGLSPIFYITVGSGIGGGFIIDGEIYRGCGRGAAEIGHTTVFIPYDPAGEKLVWGPLELFSSGWAIADFVNRRVADYPEDVAPILRPLARQRPITTRDVAEAARGHDRFAELVLQGVLDCLAEAIRQVIVLLCPRRIVIGGGVSLMGAELFFEPLRGLLVERGFEPFAGLTDIVPAVLGEEVVVHGAIALARKRFGN